jgi:hypothetical protein
MTTTSRLLLWGAAASALTAVAAAYLDPHVMIDLANKVWSCF